MRLWKVSLWGLALLALVLSGSLACTGETGEATKWYNRGVGTSFSELKIQYYTKAIELNPDYTYAYNNRGGAYLEQGLHDRAIADLNKAIELKPDYALAYNNRGVAYQKKGFLDRAIADYNKAIELKPDDARAYSNRGFAYQKKGLLDRAITDQNKAIELKPDYALAYFNRGVAYRKKGLWARAIADYNKAIEVMPDDAHAYNHLAWVLATSPDPLYRDGKRAVELAMMAVKLDGGPRDLDALAAAYAEVGRFEEAIRTQVQVIALFNKKGDKSNLADAQKRLELYKAHKRWRMK